MLLVTLSEIIFLIILLINFLFYIHCSQPAMYYVAVYQINGQRSAESPTPDWAGSVHKGLSLLRAC